MIRRILMIVTSNARMGDTGRPTGFWADELALPYFALRDAGAVVDIASPRGGPVPVDPGSLKPAGQNETAVERLLADAALQAQLISSLRAADVDASGYDVVFFPGGHGAMWDLPSDPGVTAVVQTAFAQGRLIASVCHGAAGLVTARTPEGTPVVRGRRINAFTDTEEAAVGLTDAMPFALEGRLRELGATFESAPPWQAFAIRDGQFVTGQNPQSSALVADLVLEALDLTSAAATV